MKGGANELFTSFFLKIQNVNIFPVMRGVERFNCLFCYCPMYHIEHCPGNPVYIEKNGVKIKVCTNCNFPHRPENYDIVVARLKKENNKR